MWKHRTSKFIIIERLSYEFSVLGGEDAGYESWTMKLYEVESELNAV